MKSQPEQSLRLRNVRLEKELAAKTRDLEIEAALERVRARAMAMQSSGELNGLIGAVFNELTTLDLVVTRCRLWIFDPATLSCMTWAANQETPANPLSAFIKYNERPFYQAILKVWKEQSLKLVYELKGTEKKSWDEFLFSETGFSNLPEVVKVGMRAHDRVLLSASFGKFGAMQTGSLEPLSDEQIDILSRFVKVFDQTYTRFLDLQKAEAQAREGQIELALERVRARTMAMQKSEELPETASVLFQQFKDLGGDPIQITIGIVNEAEGVIEFSVTDWRGGGFEIGGSFKGSIDEPTLLNKEYKAWKEQKKSLVVDLTGQELQDWISYRNVWSSTIAKSEDTHGRRVVSFAFFSKGHISISTTEPPPPETIRLLERFAGVFDGTYTRFLDLQKAEAQAREAQIELALERVRARTMAMQHSDELAETAYILFQQFRELGENPDQATIGIINEEEGVIEYWVTLYGDKTNRVFKFSFDEPNVTNKIYKAWKSQERSIVIDLAGKELRNFMKYRAGMGGAAYNQHEKRRIINVAFFSKGLINVQSSDTRSAESIRLLERFAKVFDSTYTRFLDLQKAEAQAREAQIQLGLERVRARTMAMQQSTELAETVSLVSHQLLGLGLSFSRVGFLIWKKDAGLVEGWMSNSAFDGLLPPMVLPFMEDEGHRGIYEASLRGEHSYEQVLGGNALKRHYEWLLSQPSVPDTLKTTGDGEFVLSQIQYKYSGIFKQGYLMLIATEPQPEASNLLERFAMVFEQAYTRFLDLQRAEAQARESQIQLAMERVRAKTMAMQRSDELADAASLLFRQVSDFGIKVWSSAFQIWNADDISTTAWASAPDGGIQAPFRLPYNEDIFFKRIYQARQSGKDFFVMESSGKELEDTYHYMFNLPGVKKYFDDAQDLGFPIPKYQITHCAFFSDGYLMFITYEPCLEMWDIFKRFGKVFEQTYTRFLDLQKAEGHAKEAQVSLAMERIRARAMAMHSSEELIEVANVLREQMGLLGQPDLETSAVHLYDDSSDTFESLYAFRPIFGSDRKTISKSTTFPKDSCELVREMTAMYRSKVMNYTLEASGLKREEWLEVAAKAIPEIVETTLANDASIPDTTRFHFSDFHGGSLLMVSYQQPSEEAKDLQRRAASVFDLAYRRFLDLKHAEEQAREAKIEAALERVRSRTMAMQRSDELQGTALLLFQQAEALGVNAFACGFNIWDDDRKFATGWMGSVQGLQPPFKTDSSKDIYLPIYEAAQRGEAFFVREQSGEELKVHYDYLATIPIFKDIIMVNLAKVGLAIPTFQIIHCAFFAQGYLMFISYEPCPEAYDIFKRFAKVFEQTYTRFLDLKRAEEQAREAQIELSLERVRAKTMAMHDSQDVGDTVATMFDELVKLGVDKTMRCGVGIIHNSRQFEVWTASTQTNGEVVLNIGTIDMMIHPLMAGLYHEWRAKKDHYTSLLLGEEVKNYYRAINATNCYTVKFDIDALPSKQINNCFIFPEGALYTFSPEPLTQEASKIATRFASVFGQTYRRYCDLQKAEAQAREAQIEAALERVRSRTMAMQKSDELREVIQLVFEQLKQLNFNIDSASFALDYKESDDFNLWISSAGQSYPTKIHTPYLDHPLFNRFIEAKKNEVDFLTENYSFEEKNAFFNHFFKNVQGVSEERKEFVLGTTGYARSTVLMKNVTLTMQNYAAIPYSEEENAALRRFGKVFEQTYTRFLDLQTAEEQVREAKIEGSLERVRGKAMAMHNSADLTVTANMVFTELDRLGINPIRCGIGLLSKDSRKALLYSATISKDTDALALVGWVVLEGHPVLTRIYDSWASKEDYFPSLNGKELKSYYERLLSGLAVPSVPDWQSGEKQYGHFLQFPEGCLYAWAEKPYTDNEIKILDRFKGIISLTFRRYIELQKSEANARDAIRQASLDRVRAEIASMRSIDDLGRITPLIWNELIILGIPFIRCGVFIIDEQERLIHTHLSTADGKALAAFDLQFDSEGIGQNVLPAWRKKQIAAIHWSEEEFATYTNDLVERGSVKPDERYVTEHPNTSLDLHFLPFLQGMLYVGNTSPLISDEMDLVQSLADAFSTAYARYEDFNKLEIAKQQVENTLTDLKLTQTRLIQSEKMASLGELTAGIAHEIQNPLNFVNNFSEVNQEMIDELEEELNAGNIEEALAIAADIKQNEQKINHHGKRADGIVKGMLQHSRASGGEKQPTNINSVADEYMRLAYHGLRAKDKIFNAEMITHFDPDLPRIEVVGQDIGRVILNLFNNAFYAVNQKKKVAANDYNPEVSITTSTENGQVIIKVKDNGVGMPDQVKDKIMQPFFTTKPTGEGTGLGLSLTYDMVVKGHGGSIAVTSKEGEGSEFTIQLPIS